ncbi:MAG: acyl transferase, partial [Flavobacteriaceae bacterium]
TGGMKGRRKELVRDELHAQLKQTLDVEGIQSEYGMTELLSQAYAKDNGRFRCPPWMKVFVRNPNNPLDIQAHGTGCLNIIDLANKNSCAFIGTDDLGRVYFDGTFEVIGRADSSDVRGCNLMVS